MFSVIIFSSTDSLNSLSPVFFDIFLSWRHSSEEHNVNEVPTFPARAVLPTLWM